MANCISVKNVIVSNKDCTPSSGKTLKGTTLSYLAYSLSEYYRNALYDLLNGTGYFSSKTLSKYTEQEDVGIYGLRIYGELFQVACVLDKAAATKVELRVYNSNDYYSTYVITSLDTEALLQIGSEEITLTTGLTTFMYRGSKNGSFMINISINGSNKQNMRFFEVHKLKHLITGEDVIAMGKCTVAGGTYHVANSTALYGCGDNYTGTISAVTCNTYSNYLDFTYSYVNLYNNNVLSTQFFLNGLLEDKSLIAGSAKYYKRYNYYKVEGHGYYCVVDGYLWKVE